MLNVSLQATSLIAAEKFREAEAVLQPVIAAEPSWADGRYLLAYTMLRENRATEALAEYSSAARLQRPSAQDLKRVAMAYVLLGGYPAADRWAGRSVEMNAQDADAWYVLGRIRFEMKCYGDAVNDFHQVLKLAPHSVKAENNLGLAYEGLNRNEDAIAAYRQAIDWQRDAMQPSEQPLLNLATLLIHENSPSQALPLLLKAAVLAPKDPNIHEQLGKLYLEQNELGLAETEFQLALESKPGSAALHFLLGQAYRRNGLVDKAKAQFAHAAALTGTHSMQE